MDITNKKINPPIKILKNMYSNSTPNPYSTNFLSCVPHSENSKNKFPKLISVKKKKII